MFSFRIISSLRIIYSFMVPRILWKRSNHCYRIYLILRAATIANMALIYTFRNVANSMSRIIYHYPSILVSLCIPTQNSFNQDFKWKSQFQDVQLTQGVAFMELVLKDQNYRQFKKKNVFRFSSRNNQESVSIILKMVLGKTSFQKDEPKPKWGTKAQIGLSDENFAELLAKLISLHRYFQNNENKAREALEIYLTRLRTGEYFKYIATVFNISEKTVKKYTDAARTALLIDFVPLHLGLWNVSLQILIDNSSEMARELYSDGRTDCLMIVAGGTYNQTNKSKNYDLQRSTYSDQKKKGISSSWCLNQEKCFRSI